MVSVNLRMNTRKNISNKGDWTTYSNMLTILGSTIDMIFFGGVYMTT
jgi:hypothetical protein